jgi:hypothetical protein
VQKTLYEKHFTLDEAVGLLPFVQQTLEKAHRELAELRDEIVLYKRMNQVQEEEGILNVDPACGSLADVLHHKWHLYEECFYRWVNVLSDKGIQVRDFKRGLVDFPYRSKNGTEYLLCWQLGEEGLFYFHSPSEGFAGRKPTTLLPE